MLKRCVAVVIAVLPIPILRRLLYRVFLGYRIFGGSRVGFGTVIVCRECQISGANIGWGNLIECDIFEMKPGSQLGKLNSIRQCHSVQLAAGSVLVDRNRIIGTRAGISPFKQYESFSLGEGSIITSGHHFDVSDTIAIGRDVTVGGNGCQIWTHGFDPNRIKIQAGVTIGDNVYIGSRSIIVQGVNICSQVSIAAGTIVSKSICEPGFYVSSQLVRKGEVPDYSHTQQVVEFQHARFVRK